MSVLILCTSVLRIIVCSLLVREVLCCEPDTAVDIRPDLMTSERWQLDFVVCLLYGLLELRCGSTCTAVYLTLTFLSFVSVELTKVSEIWPRDGSRRFSEALALSDSMVVSSRLMDVCRRIGYRGEVSKIVPLINPCRLLFNEHYSGVGLWKRFTRNLVS